MRKPTIETASLSQMLSLTPNDVFVKLKFLTLVLGCLFGFMARAAPRPSMAQPVEGAANAAPCCLQFPARVTGR